LVDFAKKQTDGYEGVEITDLVESFYDGLAFCAIVDKMKPGVLNWEEVRKVCHLKLQIVNITD
jgi:actinin alpha